MFLLKSQYNIDSPPKKTIKDIQQLGIESKNDQFFLITVYTCFQIVVSKWTHGHQHCEAPALGGLVPCSKKTSLISLATSAPSKWGGPPAHFWSGSAGFFRWFPAFFRIMVMDFSKSFCGTPIRKKVRQREHATFSSSPYPLITASEWPVQAIFGSHPPELSGCWLCAWRATDFFSNLWSSTLPGCGYLWRLLETTAVETGISASNQHVSKDILAQQVCSQLWDYTILYPHRPHQLWSSGPKSQLFIRDSCWNFRQRWKFSIRQAWWSSRKLYGLLPRQSRPWPRSAASCGISTWTLIGDRYRHITRIQYPIRSASLSQRPFILSRKIHWICRNW